MGEKRGKLSEDRLPGFCLKLPPPAQVFLLLDTVECDRDKQLAKHVAEVRSVFDKELRLFSDPRPSVYCRSTRLPIQDT